MPQVPLKYSVSYIQERRNHLLPSPGKLSLFPISLDAPVECSDCVYVSSVQ